MTMTLKTKWTIALAVIAVLTFAVMEGGIKPHWEQKEMTYQEEQKDPLTHDFSRLLPYHHPYMGNAGNLINLNHEHTSAGRHLEQYCARTIARYG